MKILISASTMSHIESFHRPYIEKLKEQGHEVHILTGSEGSTFSVKFKKKTLSFSNLSASFKIRKYLKEMNFDVVFLHTSLAAFWVRMAMKGMKKRPYVVNTVHGYLFGSNSGRVHNKIYLLCEKILKKQTDDIIVMNKEDYDIATENKLCKGNVYFSNGMGVSFKREDVQGIRADEERPNLLFVGEFSKRKNQMFLIDAMEHLQDLSLTLVGGGDASYVERIKKYVEEKHLQNRVNIIGYTREVYEYIKGCDVYVSASNIEGLPFNIMEAMYMKKPIVASDIKGHADLLSSDMLFTPNNMEEYVALVKKSLEKKEVFYDIEKYSLENVLDENMELYGTFTKKKQPSVAKSQP